MKLTRFSFLVLAASFAGLTPLIAQDDLKVATVDMRQVFAQYFKTKEAEGRLNDARTQARKEYDDRVEFVKKTENDARALNDDANVLGISESERELKVQALNAKLAEFQGLQQELRNFQQTREKQISDQSNRSRNLIVEEINKVVMARASAFDLVFDKSGDSTNAVPIVIFSNGSFDLTNEVIAELNKAKPAEKK